MAAAALVSDALLLGRARPRGRAALPPVRASARIVTRAAPLAAPPRLARRAPREPRRARLLPPRPPLGAPLDSRVGFRRRRRGDLCRVGGRRRRARVGGGGGGGCGGRRRRRFRRLLLFGSLLADVRGPRPAEASVRGARVGRVLGTVAAPARGYPLTSSRAATSRFSRTRKREDDGLSPPCPSRGSSRTRDLPENERSTDVQCLVVVPSQELAMQIVRQMERVLGDFGRSVTQQCIGGANKRRQEEAIRKKTPRRRRHPGPSRRAQPHGHPPDARRQVSGRRRGGRPPREQLQEGHGAHHVDHTGKPCWVEDRR